MKPADSIVPAGLSVGLSQSRNIGCPAGSFLKQRAPGFFLIGCVVTLNGLTATRGQFDE